MNLIKCKPYKIYQSLQKRCPPMITTSAVKKQGPTLEVVNVYTLKDKASNYGKKL